MIAERIGNPEVVTSDDIEKILVKGRRATVQFSDALYSTELLESLNDLCSVFGTQLEVRFFGFYGGSFDASVLAHLPEVRSLSVDCMRHIRNEDEITRLPQLEHLTLGVYELDEPEFLSTLPLERLTLLSISENRKRDFNLAPLGRCGDLKDLYIHGHTKQIATLANLPQVQALRLSGMPKRQELPFVSDMAGLKSLSLLLGGRQSINEVHHPSLEELSIVRVRSLETLGELARFPALRRLHVEDQIQLRSLSISGPRLNDIKVLNCKNLNQISGLLEQVELTHFRAFRIQHELLEKLLESDWPASAEIVALYANSEKWNKVAREKLDSRGFREFS